MRNRAWKYHLTALALWLLAVPAAAQPAAPAVPPAATPAQPQTAALSPDAKFAAFIVSFRDTAIAAGVKPQTYDRSMTGLRRDPDVEAANLAQPEFAKPVWAYLDVAVSPQRVSTGQQMLAAYGTALANIESRFGVPREILVAIWGMESNYGQSMGGYNMFDALATLAYDGPRAEFGRRELIAALKMEDEGGFAPASMTSSWAGAFGHTQFIPSAYLAHGVDGDGDGRIDLWNSPADALASSASLLADAGWVRGAAWGYEVTLPAGFAYEAAEMDQKKSVADWTALGVKTAAGGALPASAAPGSIITPAGARGPAFLVFDNFRNVLKYNNAQSYALAVCILADEIAGRAGVAASWPRTEPALTRDQRMAIQTDLKKLGYDPGDIDGVIGHQVRAALRQYQKANGLAADGFATVSLYTRLEADVKAKGL